MAPSLGFPDPARYWHGESSVGAMLRARPAWQRTPRVEQPRPRPTRTTVEEWRAFLGNRYPNLRRHFVFEYYPWYAADPWLHWDEAGREPPDDIAASSMPLLGAYDSRDPRVIERHARWMAEAGIGAINVSWWGQHSYPDTVVPLLMDVMRAHDIHVTFHLEPYAPDRAQRYVSDVLYLLREYGERRRWDAFLLLPDAGGRVGPVFKSFRTVLPRQVVDCHGLTHDVPDYTPDTEWRRQTDRVRAETRRDFDRITLLADSLHFPRSAASGFDGIAIYDNYVAPQTWRPHAEAASRERLLFSFNINPGFDGILPRPVPSDPCYQPLPFEPPAGDLDFSTRDGRTAATELGRGRIRESFMTTVGLQCDRALWNAREGVFLTYVNSFNEWHEGTQFEPMKNAADLSPGERRFGYHNVDEGDYRIKELGRLVGQLL